MSEVGHKWPASKFSTAHLPLIKINMFAVFICCAVRNWNYNRIPNKDCGRILGKELYKEQIQTKTESAALVWATDDVMRVLKDRLWCHNY